MELVKLDSSPVGGLTALELEIEGLARRIANLELLIESQLGFLTDATSRFLEVERQRGER